MLHTVRSDNSVNGFVDLLTNLGDGEARRFDYDDENRLTAVKEYDGTLITEYAYDALGRRIEVTDHVSTADMCGDATTPVRTRQVYSGLATIQEYVWCGSLGAAGEWTAAREFLYGASFLEPVALVDWSDLGDEAAGTEEVLHYVHDRLGSVVALTDAGDPDAQPTPIPPKAVERYEYDPYGQTYVEVWDETLNGGLGDWATASDSKYGNALLWTAQRYDATVGLYHFPARAYSPRLGRWLQRDPLGYVDGVNLYEYVGSAPTMFIDPMGLMLGWRPPGGSVPSPGDYVAHDDGYGGGGWHPPWLPPDDDPFDDGFVGPPPPDPCPDGPAGGDDGDGDDGGNWSDGPTLTPPPDPLDPDLDALRDHVNQTRSKTPKKLKPKKKKPPRKSRVTITLNDGSRVILITTNTDDIADAAEDIVDGGGNITDVSIHQHGEVGIQMIGPQSALLPYDSGTQRLGNAMGSDSTLSCNGCYVGHGEEGAQYIQDLANATGTTVQANTGNVYYVPVPVYGPVYVITTGDWISSSPED